MQLQDSILKAFADSVNKSESSTSDSRTVYGTVVRKDSSGIFVRLNGADETVETPVVSMVEVGVDDVVMIVMKNHTATIIGNISWPATTRVGALYVTLTEEGLIVGRLDQQTNLPIGYYMLITDSSIQLRQIINTDPGYKILASFGTDILLGSRTEMHSTVTNYGLRVVNGAGELVSQFGLTSQIGRSADLHATVDGNGLRVFDGTLMVAKFGQTVQIGPENSVHTNINQNGMTVYNASGNVLISAGITTSSDSYGTRVDGLYTIGTIYAEGGPISVGNKNKHTKLDMIATPLGNVGLRANNSDWILMRNNQTGKIYVGGKDLDRFMYLSDFAGSQLWTGTFNPPAGGVDGGAPGDYTDSDGFRCRPISDIPNWSVICLRVKSGDEYTNIVFFKSAGDIANYLSDPAYSYNNTSYVVKTSYLIHWSAGSMGIRRVSGPDVQAPYAIVGVYGLIPIPGSRNTDTSGGTITPID